MDPMGIGNPNTSRTETSQPHVLPLLAGQVTTMGLDETSDGTSLTKMTSKRMFTAFEP